MVGLSRVSPSPGKFRFSARTRVIAPGEPTAIDIAPGLERRTDASAFDKFISVFVQQRQPMGKT